MKKHSTVINEQHLSNVNIKDMMKKGYKGVLIDIDNTLVNWKEKTLTNQAQEKLQEMKANGLKVCLVSNGKSARAKVMAETLGIYYVSKAYKPLTMGIKRAISVMGVQPHQAVMIGDQLLTDVLGAKLAGIDYILVEPISLHESRFTKLNRSIEKHVLRRKFSNRG